MVPRLRGICGTVSQAGRGINVGLLVAFEGNGQCLEIVHSVQLTRSKPPARIKGTNIMCILTFVGLW
jgi:hypothetical protein